MKKIIQNVLAKNSNNEIAYLCGKCGKEIDKEAIICSYCGAKLGNIRCPFCNFVGSINDFRFDTCPRCGRKKTKDKKNVNTLNQFNTKIEFTLTTKLFWLFFLLLLGGIAIIILAFLYNFDLI